MVGLIRWEHIAINFVDLIVMVIDLGNALVANEIVTVRVLMATIKKLNNYIIL